MRLKADPRIARNTQSDESTFEGNPLFSEIRVRQNKAGEDLPQSPPKGHVSSPHATTSFTGEVNARGLCNSTIKLSTA